MRTDNPDAAARNRLVQQLRDEKRARRKARGRAKQLEHAAAQERKMQLRKHVYIPRNKARLPDYQPGPVTRPDVPEANPAPSSDEFLRSFEWRRVRMEALRLYGARCQCCGASPATGAVINVDHIKPRKLFPNLALTVSNLQILCEACNHGKGNWDTTDWRNTSAAKVER